MSVRYRGQPDSPLKSRLHIEKPACLTGYASEHWDKVYPQLLHMGVLHEIDREALTALCQWWHEYRTLQATPAADSGEVYKRSISLASCFKNWSGLADRFGLTPKAREKMTMNLYGDNDPAAAFVR